MDFKEGVYFDLDEKSYHSVPALSASGMKNLRQSPLDFWVRSSMNPNQADVLADETSSEAKDLGSAFHKRICEGPAAFNACYAPKVIPEDFPDCLETADDLKARLRELGLKVSGSKAELIERLHEADPNAKIWDHFLDTHEAAHAGKTFLTQKWLDKIEIAAAMIERDPTFSKAFSGGASEVSIFWTCPKIGVNCKARLDYLKARAIVDLKTIQAQSGTPLADTVRLEIGRRRYHIQATFYMEAASFVAGFVKDGRSDGVSPEYDPLMKSLLADSPKTWLWIFQSKGPAPAVIGRTLSPQSMICETARAEIESLKQTYGTCLDTYGELPWVTPQKIEMLQDGDIPPWAL
jgi:hypothetical protein